MICSTSSRRKVRRASDQRAVRCEERQKGARACVDCRRKPFPICKQLPIMNPPLPFLHQMTNRQPSAAARGRASRFTCRELQDGADLSATTAVNCRYPGESTASEATGRYVERRARSYIAERRRSDLVSRTTYPSRSDGPIQCLSATLSTHRVNESLCYCKPCTLQHFFAETISKFLRN